MKKMFNKMSNTVKTMTCKAHCAMTCARAHLSAPLCNTRGEGYIDTAIKILIAVVLGFWRGIWGMALGLLLAVLYFCTAMLFQKFIHHPLPAMTRAALPLGPFLSIGFAALYCFGG